MVPRSGALLYVATVIGAALVACGGSSTSTSAPTPEDGVVFSCNGSKTCTFEGACCSETAPDSFGPSGYRCTGGAWKTDDSCVPPPAPCPSPLTGSLAREGGAAVGVTCFGEGGIVGVVSARITLGSGETLELYFSRVPRAGEAATVLPYDARGSFPDARDAGGDDAGGSGGGGALSAVFRIGRAGGFSGFAASAESASGTLTVTEIEATGITLRSLRVTLDATTTGFSDGWGGTLSGSW